MVRVYTLIPTIQKQSVPVKVLLSQNGVKQSNYLRTHLIKGYTEETEMKHRCSQTQFKVWQYVYTYS